MRMGQRAGTGLGHRASPVSYRHNFLVLSVMPLFDTFAQCLPSTTLMPQHIKSLNEIHETYEYVDLVEKKRIHVSPFLDLAPYCRATPL